MVLDGIEWVQAMEAAGRLLPGASRTQQRSRATILLRLAAKGEFGKRKDPLKGQTAAVYLDWTGIQDYYKKSLPPGGGVQMSGDKATTTQADYSQPDGLPVGPIELIDSNTHDAWYGPLSVLMTEQMTLANGVGRQVAPRIGLLVLGTPAPKGEPSDEKGLRWSLHCFPKGCPSGRVKTTNLALKGFRRSISDIKAALPEFVKAVVAGCIIGIGLLLPGGAL